MRTALPSFAQENESGVVNLDDHDGPGTHWVAYKKRGHQVDYFDSYGDLRPPRELITYLCSSPGTVIRYNVTQYQDADDWNCGHLALLFLAEEETI